MTNYTTKFETARKIAEKYQQPIISDIKVAEKELPDFKVTVPIVGGFSTGKSSLLNSVIGEKLLSTAITPETAVPTELVYGDDTATLIKKSGAESKIPLSEFKPETLSVADYELVKINTSAEAFSKLKSLKIVDMPGFDSGCEVHNKAIDNYLPKSLAYVIAIAADEGTLKESIINFLNELKLHNVNVYVVITKSDKALPETINDITIHITEVVRRYLNLSDVKVAVTSAKRGSTDTKQFEAMLVELEQKSADIMDRYFNNKLSLVCSDLERYLEDRLKKSDFTEEELRSEKEQLERNMTALQGKIQKERADFDNRVANCVSSIENRVRGALSTSETTLENMLMQDIDINDKVNSIVRSAVTSAMKSELEPIVTKYVGKVSLTIQDGFTAAHSNSNRQTLKQMTELPVRRQSW